MAHTVLIVDDEPVQRRLLENVINKMGHRAVTCENGDNAVEMLQVGSGPKIDVVVLDLVMPGLDGMGVLSRLEEMNIDTPVVVQTSKGGIDTVVSAIRAGAVDFCVKPVSPERLKVSIQNALKLGAMEKAVDTIRKTSNGNFTFDDMIADSPAMTVVTNLGLKGAASSIPILIEGESGVGKEVLAKAIQGSSDRHGKPFVTVNCGALPENLVESILFGHEKGAFTGATSNHVGKFKEADGGTLFLDEVGELSADIQVKLLRALQEGEVDPVGARKPVKTNFRLISATNRNMADLVKSGHFREDLYYRLNVFPIELPPLRDRKSDIPALVQHFVARICLEEGRRKISGIDNHAMGLLENYDWPGNIRQLENMIFRAVIMCDGDVLTVNEFPQIAMTVDPAMLQSAQSPSANPATSALGGGMLFVQNAPSIQSPMPAPIGHKGAVSSSISLLREAGKMRSIQEIEAEMIKFALSHHKGRMTRVARSLGIGRSTLYRKMKEFGLDDKVQSPSED